MVGLSVINITTPADMHSGKWIEMVKSLPSGVELVVLVNTIGSSDTEPHLIHTSEHDGVMRIIYEATYSDLNLARIRNDATALASHDWCMWLDSDDVIAYGDPLKVVADVHPTVGAVRCQVVGMQSIDGGRATYYATPQTRLWRRSAGYKWVGYVHEVLDIASAQYMIVDSDIIINHSGYVTSSSAHRKRLERNVRGLCATLLDVWDSREDLRAHYLDVLRTNVDALINMSNQSG